MRCIVLLKEYIHLCLCYNTFLFLVKVFFRKVWTFSSALLVSYITFDMVIFPIETTRRLLDWTFQKLLKYWLLCQHIALSEFWNIFVWEINIYIVKMNNISQRNMLKFIYEYHNILVFLYWYILVFTLE